MDGIGNKWYYSCMDPLSPIPAFTLYGETLPFPDVVHCERILDRAGQHDWHIAPHRHSQMAQVFTIEDGQARVTLDGVDSWLNAGDFLYVPPQVVHGFAFSKGTEGMVLSFPSLVANGLHPSSPALTAWFTSVDQGALDPVIIGLIANLEQCFATTGAFRTQKLIALAHALLATLAEGNATKESANRNARHQLQALDALISEHAHEGWSARNFAAALHITTGHLNRIVRDATGSSLTAYLETALMTEACRLIVFTRLPFAEIGYRLGFSDPSYFSRRFRACMHETPSAYRGRMSG